MRVHPHTHKHTAYNTRRLRRALLSLIGPLSLSSSFLTVVIFRAAPVHFEGGWREVNRFVYPSGGYSRTINLRRDSGSTCLSRSFIRLFNSLLPVTCPPRLLSPWLVRAGLARDAC